MKKNIASLLVFLFLMFVTQLFFNGTFKQVNDYDPSIKPVTIPTKLDFCGEHVPLEDEEVRERIDKELLGNAFWQSSNLMHLKKMTRYFPIIEEILKSNGLPDDIKFLAVAESGLSGAVSPVGAAGFWQFMPATGKQYGLEISDEIDERYDIEKSTQAACRYLKDMNEILNSWTLSAAAYNCGIGGVQRSLSFQRVSSYYDLYLNNETSRYVFRIIALKEILSNPEKYNYKFNKNQGYKPLQTKSINVSGPVSNWSDWAIKHGINYKTLRVYNPWIKKHLLTNKLSKTYLIEIPADVTILNLDSQFGDKLELQVDDTTSKLHKLEDFGNFKTYLVKPGDDLQSIALKLNVRIEDLKHWNNIKSSSVNTGKKLRYINDISE